jgi:cyclase
MVVCKRVIPVQLLSRGRLVKTRGFAGARDVGAPVSSSRVYYANGADEIVFLNIDRGAVDVLCRVLEAVSEVLFVPITAGGGITCEADAAALIRAGADKVVVNSAAYSDPGIISRIGRALGCQAVCVSIDVMEATQLYSKGGSVRETVTLQDHVRRVVDAGAGEILVNSIDRDGTMGGYDLDLIREVRRLAPGIPVVALGGAGNYQHLADAIELAGVDGVAAGSLFNFTDSNPMRAKAYLRNRGIACRV